MKRLVTICATLVAHPVAAQDYITFQTPSQNIVCGMFADDYPGVRCDMYQLTPSYTQPPEDCEFDWGSSFWIGAGGATGELACVSDAVGNPPFQVLPYGATTSFGGVTCRSEQSGLTCTNGSGHGFTLSRARQRLY